MYKFQTTFWSDFTIADHFGVDAIRDTYKRAFNEWKTDTVYVTELTMVLNWKIFEWWEKGDNEYAEVYDTLWRQTDEYCMKHLKGKDLDYYLKVTDWKRGDQISPLIISFSYTVTYWNRMWYLHLF